VGFALFGKLPQKKKWIYNKENMPNPIKKIQPLNLSCPKWAFCFNTGGNPSTWGMIREMDEMRAVIKYGKDAPIWDSNLWINKYIKVVDTENEARNIVEDYRKTIQYATR